MKIIKPSVELMPLFGGVAGLEHLESCGRVCYKSEDKITEGSAEKFIGNIIKRKHGGVIEHLFITLKFTCDRGVSHEIVRHRMASYCQESTRYCNYSNDKFGRSITVIEPCFLEGRPEEYMSWQVSCNRAETAYFNLLDLGCTPQEARTVLPNSLKTELVMTANPREWRHFLELRCDGAAHPQMREVAFMALEVLHDSFPVLFDDIWEKFAVLKGA